MRKAVCILLDQTENEARSAYCPKCNDPEKNASLASSLSRPCPRCKWSGHHGQPMSVSQGGLVGLKEMVKSRE